MTEWKIIPSWPGYEASNEGQIRRRFSVPTGGWAAGKLITPKLRKDGYLEVRLTKDGRRHWQRSHRLVCEAFNGPRPTPKHGAAHKNGNSIDNKETNLYWGTQQQNIDDRERHGRTMRSDDHYAAKLKSSDIPIIRNCLAAGETAYSIAKRYPVTETAISCIKRGRSWKSV